MVHGETSTDLHLKDPLKIALNVISLAIFVIDKTLTIRWVNRGAETLFGQKGQQLVGQSIDPVQGSIWTWSQGLKFGETVPRLFRGGDPILGAEQQVTLMWDGKKTPHHLRINASPIEFAGDQMVLMALEDITSVKELEKVTTETERLNLTIQTARATAHELNQPLSVLVGNLDLLKRQMEVDGSFSNRIDKISTSAERVTEVVRRLQMTMHSPRETKTVKASRVGAKKNAPVT